MKKIQKLPKAPRAGTMKREKGVPAAAVSYYDWFFLPSFPKSSHVPRSDLRPGSLGRCSYLHAITTQEPTYFLFPHVSTHVLTRSFFYLQPMLGFSLPLSRCPFSLCPSVFSTFYFYFYFYFYFFIFFIFYFIFGGATWSLYKSYTCFVSLFCLHVIPLPVSLALLTSLKCSSFLSFLLCALISLPAPCVMIYVQRIDGRNRRLNRRSVFVPFTVCI